MNRGTAKSMMLASLLLMMVLTLSAWASSPEYTIGAFYYPKWRSDQINWNDLQGRAGSRSPGKPWPEREPILGFYPEEEPWVAQRHIDWASRYGIGFFAYDWRWDVDHPVQEHALKNYLAAGNRDKLRFCLLWDYHSARFDRQHEFDAMVAYWIENYFREPTYYRIDNKPVIFLFSSGQSELNAERSGATVTELLARAKSRARSSGLAGIYFILTTNEPPCPDLERMLHALGFDAYTGRNYAEQKGARTADYDQMVDAYLDCYRAAAKTGKELPYIASASPGRDARPWSGSRAMVRSNPTPEKFERMLRGAKALLDDPKTRPKVLMIEAWNEFGEGSYIEPTKKWGMRYLEAIRKVIGPGVPEATVLR